MLTMSKYTLALTLFLETPWIPGGRLLTQGQVRPISGFKLRSGLVTCHALAGLSHRFPLYVNLLNTYAARQRRLASTHSALAIWLPNQNKL